MHHRGFGCCKFINNIDRRVEGRTSCHGQFTLQAGLLHTDNTAPSDHPLIGLRTLRVMPPLDPSPSALNSPPRRRPISRVNSLKRDWEDSGLSTEQKPVKKLGMSSRLTRTDEIAKENVLGSQEIEWTPSPPTERRCVPACFPDAI
jgi:hypothetical protein